MQASVEEWPTAPANPCQPAEETHRPNTRQLLHAAPGPEALQLATYIGWLMHRTRGGIMAGGLFILPGVVALMMLSAQARG
jgi:chromate transporter